MDFLNRVIVQNSPKIIDAVDACYCFHVSELALLTRKQGPECGTAYLLPDPADWV